MLGRDKLDKLVGTAFATMEEEQPSPETFVGVALLIVECRTSEGATAFYTFCTDKRQWIQRAAVQEAAQAIEYEEIEVEADDA
jgi:hypothetical protein